MAAVVILGGVILLGIPTIAWFQGDPMSSGPLFWVLGGVLLVLGVAIASKRK